MKTMITLIFLALLFLNGCSSQPQVCFENTCFDAEVARTPQEQQFGLMHRNELHENKGMLFFYESDFRKNFWMKNTKIPLDIIWINNASEVIYISKNTPPCTQDPCPSYGPSENARHVFEINGGLSDKYGIYNGTKVSFKNI